MWRRSQPGSRRPTDPTETTTRAAPPAWPTLAVGALAGVSLLVGAAAWMSARLVERELAEITVQRSEEYLHRLAMAFGDTVFTGVDRHRLLGAFPSSPHQILVTRVLSPSAVVIKTSATDEIGRRIDVTPAVTGLANGVGRWSPQARPGVIRLARPVLNEPRCFPCHGPTASVLGFVSLDVSPAPPRAALPFWALSGAAGTTAVTSLLLVGLVWRRRPGRPAGHSVALSVGSEAAREHDGQLLRAGRLAALGELTSSIAHEVKNPLAGIGSAVQVLARGFPEGDPRREISEEILGEVRRLQYMVRGVLDAASLSPDPIVADVRAPLERTLFLVRAMAKDQGTLVVERLAPSLPHLRIDPRQLQQVLLNLAMNGLQALGKGGAVTISAVAGPAGSWVDITVEDTGPGITVENQPRIFEPFYTTKRDGTGLGLTIVRQIVETHGGRITVDSRPGLGTRFTVRLFAAPQVGSDGS